MFCLFNWVISRLKPLIFSGRIFLMVNRGRLDAGRKSLTKNPRLCIHLPKQQNQHDTMAASIYEHDSLFLFIHLFLSMDHIKLFLAIKNREVNISPL